MTMGGKKVMTRGRRSKNKKRAEKKALMPNRGLKYRVCNAPSPDLEKRQSEV
jgi:hypothetical protein